MKDTGILIAQIAMIVMSILLIDIAVVENKNLTVILKPVNRELPILIEPSKVLHHDACECIVILLPDGRSGWIEDPECGEPAWHYPEDYIQTVIDETWPGDSN